MKESLRQNNCSSKYRPGITATPGFIKSGFNTRHLLRTIALSVDARVEHTGRDVTFTAISKP